MNRINKSDLEARVDRINTILDAPSEPYTKTDNGYQANPGNNHLDWVYGGVKLVRMCDGGGCSDVLPTGFGTKRELYDAMGSYLIGLSA